MAAPETKKPKQEFVEIVKPNKLLVVDDSPSTLIEQIYQILWRYSSFELFIISPVVPTILPPNLVYPELLPNSEEREFVYKIHDHGMKLSTSRGEELYSAGTAMYKMHLTIEKMIFMLVERLKTTSGVDTQTEVQVAFGGHQLAQRKAFESIINLSYNVVVTNFNPGEWGQHYLETVKRLASKGYGYPAASPRDIYRKSHGNIPKARSH